MDPRRREREQISEAFHNAMTEPSKILEGIGHFFCGSRLRATTCLSVVLIVAGVWAMWPTPPMPTEAEAKWEQPDTFTEEAQSDDNTFNEEKDEDGDWNDGANNQGGVDGATTTDMMGSVGEDGATTATQAGDDMDQTGGGALGEDGTGTTGADQLKSREDAFGTTEPLPEAEPVVGQGVDDASQDPQKASPSGQMEDGQGVGVKPPTEGAVLGGPTTDGQTDGSTDPVGQPSGVMGKPSVEDGQGQDDGSNSIRTSQVGVDGQDNTTSMGVASTDGGMPGDEKSSSTTSTTAVHDVNNSSAGSSSMSSTSSGVSSTTTASALVQEEPTTRSSMGMDSAPQSDFSVDGTPVVNSTLNSSEASSNAWRRGGDPSRFSTTTTTGGSVFQKGQKKLKDLIMPAEKGEKSLNSLNPEMEDEPSNGGKTMDPLLKKVRDEKVGQKMGEEGLPNSTELGKNPSKAVLPLPPAKASEQ